MMENENTEKNTAPEQTVSTKLDDFYTACSEIEKTCGRKTLSGLLSKEAFSAYAGEPEDIPAQAKEFTDSEINDIVLRARRGETVRL